MGSIPAPATLTKRPSRKRRPVKASGFCLLSKFLEREPYTRKRSHVCTFKAVKVFFKKDNYETGNNNTKRVQKDRD